MKPFTLEPGMLTMRGVFYPTGYMFLMFPTLQDARSAVKNLLDDGYESDAISLVAPETVLGKIAHTVGGADTPLPSAGTEAETVRRYAELASQGHHGVMVHAPTAGDTAHVMKVLDGANISFGQKYRHLVIEDLG